MSDADQYVPLPPDQKAIAKRLREEDQRNIRLNHNEPGHADPQMLASGGKTEQQR